MKITEKIVDVQTGEETLVERDATPEEIVKHNEWQTKVELEAQALAEAAAKRQALLDKLGITEDEARLLLGGN